MKNQKQKSFPAPLEKQRGFSNNVYRQQIILDSLSFTGYDYNSRSGSHYLAVITERK